MSRTRGVEVYPGIIKLDPSAPYFVQSRTLAGCKSPYRQLPVVGRLAYPMRGEATNRVLLGRKSPGCPAGVFAAVGTIWGASKLGGRNITKYLQPRKSPRTKSFQAG